MFFCISAKATVFQLLHDVHIAKVYSVDNSFCRVAHLAANSLCFF